MSLRFRRSQRRRSHPKIWGLLLVLLLWSTIFGWGLAQVTVSNPVRTITPSATPQLAQAGAASPVIGTVDRVPKAFQYGQQIYLQACGSCHLALPPQVLPTQTWRDVIADSNHYGAVITPLAGVERSFMWRYLSTFSRPLNEGEETPYRVGKSRYFKVLHPQVTLPQPVKMEGCVTCHPGAGKNDFRSLSAEWTNSP
jgi:hypothetical protein